LPPKGQYVPMPDKDNNVIPNKIVLKAIWKNYFRVPYFKTTFFIRYKLSILSAWSVLRKIGNQKIIQFTILVPVIGYYIIFSSQFCEFIATAETVNIGVSCTENTPSQKTFEIYFAFVFLGIASLLYSFCPKTVKQYANEVELVHTEEQYLTELDIKHYSKLLYNMLKVNPDTSFGYKVEFEPTIQSALSIAADNKKLSDLIIVSADNASEITLRERLIDSINEHVQTLKNHKVSLLKLVYTTTDLSLPKTRVTILTLYFLGFSILLWHGIATFFSIYAIYYNNSPTHFIRQIVEYISALL